MKNVAVFFGGESVEHDVSVITGALTVNSIDKQIYKALPIYVDRSGEWFTGDILKDVDEFKTLNKKKLKLVTLNFGDNTLYEIKRKKLKPICKIAVAINCMHGERGEDGCLAGVLNMCKIPLASPDIMPSSVCMDKSFTKTIMKGLKIKTLPSLSVCSQDDLKMVIKKVKYPVVVKPAKLGSSIGICIAKTQRELEIGVDLALRYGERVIIEPKLDDFIEINCAAYLSEDNSLMVSECERPMNNGGLLSFDDKYKKGGRIFPADISNELSDKIKEITRKVYFGLYAQGVIRIDYFVKGEEVYLNEVNTVPGSLAFYLFSDTLACFTKMLNELLKEAEQRYNRLSSVEKTFKTSILNMNGAKSKNACKK